MSTLFTDVMTVYNHYEDPDTEEVTWQRTVVKGVQWRHNKKELAVSDGVQTEDRVESITIDCEHNYGNRSYVSPSEYKQLTADKRVNNWTLDAKSGQDIVVYGETNTEVTRLRNLADELEYYTVKSVSDNRNRPLLKHIKVVAK